MKALESQSQCKSLSLVVCSPDAQALVEGMALGEHLPQAGELEMAARCQAACRARSTGSVCTLVILDCAGL